MMLKKNIEKEERKKRKTWAGLYTRKTPTKKEKEEKINKKYIDKYIIDKYSTPKY